MPRSGNSCPPHGQFMRRKPQFTPAKRAIHQKSPHLHILFPNALQLVSQTFIKSSKAYSTIRMQGGPLNRRASFSCFSSSFLLFSLSKKQRPQNAVVVFYTHSSYSSYCSNYENRLFDIFTTCFPIIHNLIKSLFYYKNARRTAEPPSLLFLFSILLFLSTPFSLSKNNGRTGSGRCFLLSSPSAPSRRELSAKPTEGECRTHRN